MLCRSLLEYKSLKDGILFFVSAREAFSAGSRSNRLTPKKDFYCPSVVQRKIEDEVDVVATQLFELF